MKHRILFISLLLCTQLSIAQEVHLELELHGLVCSMCTNSVERSIKKLPFVKEIQADLESATASVIVKDEPSMSLKAVALAVEKAGFSVGKFVVYHTFEQEADVWEVGHEKIKFLKHKAPQGQQLIQLVGKHFMNKTDQKKYKSEIKKQSDENTLLAVVL